MKKGKLKSWVAILLLLLFVIVLMTVIDYNRAINQFETPIFAQPISQDKDGGSDTFRGALYYLEIESNITEDMQTPIISKVEFYIFGLKLSEAMNERVTSISVLEQ